VSSSAEAAGDAQQVSVDDLKADHKPDPKCPERVETNSAAHHELNHTIPMKTWRQRLTPWSYTPEPIWPYFYRPFVVLTTFPAVLFCAVQYACSIVWLNILLTVIAMVFPGPPYLFTPQQVGYMSLGPFVGNLIGSCYGGFFGDRSILFFARRNKGYYEPEMRLYILLLPAVTLCGGLIMFGATVAKVSISTNRVFPPEPEN
jgi:hypothetical protein